MDPDLNLDLPSSWTAPGDEYADWPPDPTWWVSFDDERLSALIEEALEGNYGLKAAVARVDAAEASARLAGAQGLPNLSAGFNASRRKQNIFGIPIGPGGVITSRTTSYGVSLDMAWEIDLWGRVRSAKSAALADLEASAADLAGMRLSIAAQTAKACFALIESKQQVELARETVESYRLSADQVRDRYEQGVRTSLDLRLAMANLHAAEAMLEARLEGHDIVKRQLEVLLGRYPAGAIEDFDELPMVDGRVPAGLPSELLVRRPDLFAAERRYAAAEMRVSEARRAFFPSINLTGSAGTLTDDLKDIVSGDFTVWSIAAGVMQPLFQGGRLRANLALSHSLADQALADYVQALLSAFAEVESALYAEGSLARREDRLAAAVEQSEAARLLAETQYNSGIVDYITVLETQRMALNSQSELIAVKRQRLDARVNLHLALGGGFELTENWSQFLDAHRVSETEVPVE
jgi:NodT family efflux transporter outer membrane factor (OMF) lipoprotein